MRGQLRAPGPLPVPLRGMPLPTNEPGVKDRVANLKGRHCKPECWQAKALQPAPSRSPVHHGRPCWYWRCEGRAAHRGNRASGGSVMHNGPIITTPIRQVGRWLPLLCLCRLALVLARSPACTYRNTCALVTVFCISQLGWVQLHFGKHSGCFIL